MKSCLQVFNQVDEELLVDREAQEYTMSDGQWRSQAPNWGWQQLYYDELHWEDLSKKIPFLQNGPSEDGEIIFTFDALNRGNFARFINHSCSPNLFPQYVLYDHDDKRMPHSMFFFASEDIPPLKELPHD
ncbi:hypothetical protein EJB05_09820, partial [Eragrostis curvula]